MVHPGKYADVLTAATPGVTLGVGVVGSVSMADGARARYSVRITGDDGSEFESQV